MSAPRSCAGRVCVGPRGGVKAKDLTGPGFELLRYFEKRSSATKARHRLGLWFCVADRGLRDGSAAPDRWRARPNWTRNARLAVKPSADAEALWPEGERVDSEAVGEGIDRAALDAAVASNFAEPTRPIPATRLALVVVHRGRIVAERYAPGFAATCSSSAGPMTKGR